MPTDQLLVYSGGLNMHISILGYQSGKILWLHNTSAEVLRLDSYPNTTQHEAQGVYLIHEMHHMIPDDTIISGMTKNEHSKTSVNEGFLSHLWTIFAFRINAKRNNDSLPQQPCGKSTEYICSREIARPKLFWQNELTSDSSGG